MDTYKVNYHLHSHYSDGELSPAELVRRFYELEYDVISLTDHDGINGIREFLAACEAVKIHGVSGIELSTEHLFGSKNYELHILGYGIDIENLKLNNLCDKISSFRRDRNERLLLALKEMGYELSLDELYSYSKGRYIGKPNIARMMADKGMVDKPSDAFGEKIMGSEKIKAIKKAVISTEEAIETIADAGGMAVLAHPAKIKQIGGRGSEEFYSELDGLVKNLKSIGLKGIECIYPEHSEDEEYRLITLAGKYHLHVTEGTDFHGENLK